ncbi:hypothetical protein ONE63_005728 [Megalurothrips usitatus]|uniref:Uncharacterized protein n=1 Tax=Megalurothrips usitatus TaxID=439358 RepID=A0AAV7Y1D7_9NEOP|nr:hypothetical protein ONE63_005728 [Megalurothrips usitatus]
MAVTSSSRVPRWLAALVLAACLASLTAAAAPNATDDASGEEEDDDGDVDFPDSQLQQAPPPPRRALPSPVSVYVLRLLEILTGAETMGKHTRYSRAAREGYGYPAPAPLDPPESGRAVNTAASYSNYYDFLINEGSYKFWAFFQIGTAVLLVYSAFAALYYARYTYYTNVDYSDYDDDYFFRRSGRSQRAASAPLAGLSSTEYQRVMDAVDGAKFKAGAKSSS